MRYSAPLDGLRAIAILVVLIFHMAPAALPGGFIGVDVFYVLSGFLITSILVAGIDRGTFSFAEFYRRRIQRLLPNVIVTVLATVALWSLFLMPSAARQAAAHGVWALVSLSNVYVLNFLGGYWGNAAETAPLTHTWSLGVEEQFYLLYPALLVRLARLARARLRAWLIGIALASFALSVWLTPRAPAFAFYMLPTRMWQLLAGAIVALPGGAFPLRALVTSRAAGWLGLAVVLGGSMWIPSDGFPGWIALVPTIATLLVLGAITDRGDENDETSALTRLLAWPPFVRVGQWSYSIYLWHWPLITLGKAQASTFGYSASAGALIGGAAGVLCGIAAYSLVEQPLRDRGPGRARRFGIIGVGFAATVAIALVISTRPLVADPHRHFDPVSFSGFLYDVGHAPLPDLSRVTRYYDVQFPRLDQHIDEAWRTGGIVHPAGSATPSVVVIGSSHALMYSRVIDEICRDLKIPVAFLGADQRAAFFQSGATASADARAFDEARLRLLKMWRPSVVIMIDRWEARASSGAEFVPQLRGFIDEVRPFARSFAWVSQVPVLPGGDDLNQREFAAWRLDRLGHLPVIRPDANDARRRDIADAVARIAPQLPAWVAVLRPDQLFYHPDGSVRYADGRRFFYADDDHLSDAGAAEAREMFERVIRIGVGANEGDVGGHAGGPRPDR